MALENEKSIETKRTIEQKYIQEFIELYYPESKEKFQNQTIEYVLTHINEITKEAKEQLSKFMKETVKIQRRKKAKIERIQIFLSLSTEVIEKPVIIMNSYEKKEMLEEAFFSMKFHIDWIHILWEKWKEGTQITDRNVTEKEVREDIKERNCERLMFLNSLLITLLKYVYCDAETIEGYEQLEKVSEFVISAGRYQDMQTPLFKEMPAVDFFSKSEDASLEYQRYVEKMYKDKCLIGLDFKNVKFIHCKFENCIFERTSLCDTQFIGCQFSNTRFRDCCFYGNYIENSDFENVEFSHTNWYSELVQDEIIEEHYRNVLIYNSRMQQVTFRQSNLQNVTFLKGFREECVFEECITEGADIEQRVWK